MLNLFLSHKMYYQLQCNYNVTITGKIFFRQLQTSPIKVCQLQDITVCNYIKELNK